MKHKILKLNAVLLLGLGLTPLQGQTTMNVKATSGTQTAYTLSTIRKLTFPSTGNMMVTKTTATTDNYALGSVRYLNFSDLGTNIESNTELKESIKLYPNPVQDVLNIQLATAVNKTATVEILSIEGKVVYKARLTSADSHPINVSNFRQGIYLCRVNNGISIETTKFFKK